jgi:hypothetical protein
MADIEPWKLAFSREGNNRKLKEYIYPFISLKLLSLECARGQGPISALWC